MSSDLPSVPENNWKTKIYAVGGSVGLLVGLISSYLYARAAQENTVDKPEPVKTMDVVRIGVALLAIVRQITDMAAGGGKK